MRAIFRFIAANNFLTILVAFICFRFFSVFYNQTVDYFFCFGATFFCWLVYFIDKLKDTKALSLNTVSRHTLSTNDKIIQYLLGSILAILCVVNFHAFSIKNYLIILFSIPLIFSYFLISKRYLKYIKEIFSTSVIVLVVSIFPIITQLNLMQPILHLLFFLMVICNMFLLSISDFEIDKTNHFVSLSTSIGGRLLVIFFFIILAIILLLSMYIKVSFIANWAIFYAVSSILIWILSKKNGDKNLVHILADSLFLFPIIFL